MSEVNRLALDAGIISADTGYNGMSEEELLACIDTFKDRTASTLVSFQGYLAPNNNQRKFLLGIKKNGVR